MSSTREPRYHLWRALLAATTVIVLPNLVAAQIVEGLFTDQQAHRGEGLYRDHCAACHGVDLVAGLASALRGSDFEERWGRGDTSLQDLFFIQSTTMPPGLAESLSGAQHVEILAYVLSKNGVVAGTTELQPDSPVLGQARLEPMRDSAASPPPTVADFLKEDADRPAAGSGPTQAELNGAATATGQWLYHNHNYAGTRYVALDQINADNAGELEPLCVYQVGDQSTFQSGFLVYDGLLYLTTQWSTIALDATNCRPRWRHHWDKRDISVWSSNRGPALKDGLLVRGTTDGYLLCLNAATGELLWARQVADPHAGETFTMSPLIFEDKILIGPAGSENKISGWVGAFRLSDGAPVWRFHTIPKPGEPGSETWQNSPEVPVGGGAIWTPMALDSEAGLLYVPVTNPAPDLPAFLRPGDNLYTNALVVLDARTGKLKWHRQLVPNDSHDYDLTQVSPLLDVEIGGRERKLVVTAGKDGMLRTLDRDSHEILYETAVTTVENATIPVTTEGMRACPGALGGVQWNGPAYNPSTRLLYVVAVDWCSFFRAAKNVRYVPGRNYFGGFASRDKTRQGWLSAVDVGSGAVRWRYRSDLPMVAGVTTTAGNVVFTGDLLGHLLVFKADSGEELYRFQTGGAMGGGVVTYQIGGRQYVAVASGLPSNFWVEEHPGSPTVFFFALPDE